MLNLFSTLQYLALHTHIYNLYIYIYKLTQRYSALSELHILYPFFLLYFAVVSNEI